MVKSRRSRLVGLAGVGVAEVGEPLDLGRDLGELLELGRAEARAESLATASEGRHLPYFFALRRL